MRRRLAVLIVIPALVAGITIGVAAQNADIPSVGVIPVDTAPNDPNGGQWFFATLAPGQTTQLRARVSNPARVDQTVRMYFADLNFAADGTATVAERSEEVGTWGSLDSSTVTVAAQGSAIVQFSITAPRSVLPGDHVGVFVVEGGPQSNGNGLLKVVRRVATRLYVTVPGDAPRDIRIEKVEFLRDSSLLTREITVTATLRNTGGVRLQPTVKINDTDAKGPGIVLTKSVEPYLATFKVPIWGGPLRYRIDVTTKAGSLSGPARQAYASTFVVPWLLLVLLVALGLAVLGVRALWHRRGSKYTSLTSDLRRIERLLSEQASTAAGSPAPAGDAEAAIRERMKMARRAGDADTEERLRTALEERAGTKPEPKAEPAPAPTPAPAPEPAPAPDALGAILAELATAPPDKREALVSAARAFGLGTLRTRASAVDALPDDVRLMLLFRSDARSPDRLSRPAPRADRKKR